MKDFTSTALSGLSILGQAIGPQWDLTIRTWIILGKFDFELSCALFLQQHRKYDATEEEVRADVNVAASLVRMKDWLRDGLQNAINQEIKEFEMLKVKEFQNLVSQQRAAQKPHILGTVAEIAAKYKISKSEVRRLKADGKLDEWVASQSN